MAHENADGLKKVLLDLDLSMTAAGVVSVVEEVVVHKDSEACSQRRLT